MVSSIITASIILAICIIAAGLTFKIAKAAIKKYLAQPPSQIHLAWGDDASTNVKLMWHTRLLETTSMVEYRPLGKIKWHRTIGDQMPIRAKGVFHSATLSHLLPNTVYEYRINGDFAQWLWSEVHQFKTAPPLGESDFDVVYFADTGLVGRRDGLTAGAQLVINAIAELNPLFTLAGGDYAYYNTDKRYFQLESAVNAWFNQMMPVFTKSIVMPTYGNHETQLKENYSIWADRFLTPMGSAGKRNYSFDVGNAHFVSIFAVHEEQGLEPEALEWIEKDIKSAQVAGQKWMVPFMHVSAFAEGSSHPSNLELRAQLGPLFERLGIQIVLSSHDQAYERTYPLIDVPNCNRPTSHNKDGYTLSDGITWIKTSPSGKKSNKNGSFSSFKAPPSPWVAVRNNTMHVFTRLHFDYCKLTLEVFGVADNSRNPVLVDKFSYTDT